MKTKQYVLSSLIAGLMMHSALLQADDIDIYSGLGTGSNTPNVMIVVDNPSSQNNEVGPCTYSAAAGGGAPSQGSKALGNDQCALANIVASMAKNADGSALFKLGLTTLDGVILKLTPVDDNPYTGTASVTLGNTNYTIPGGSTNKQAIIIAIKALNSTSGKSGQGTELQETWAYYTGGNGTYSGINTATGLLSGITYSGTNVASGCQKNYIIYLSNVKAGASHAQDNGELPVLDAVARNALASGNITASQIKAMDPSYFGYNGVIPSKPEAGYGIEWARMMNSVDVNSTSDGLQNISTYSVATGDTAVAPAAITNSMEKYIKAVGEYGGGKYFAAANSGTELQNSILKILNEIQAVNSVFSSSSLPVSVNAQGTFLNQIYMGMFRPDAGALPRWAGNLKQYQFIYDATTSGLKLGDSLGISIINGDTGFISPDAISFWSCTDLASSNNGYLASPLTAAQKTLLASNNQSCADLSNGFWEKSSSSTNAVAKGFDLPDGELVERGGAAQHIRNANLSNDYSATPAAPRNLYTWCPSGSSCQNALTHADNTFATSNNKLVASAFGSTLTANISSLTRSGTTVSVATAANHGFSTGDPITIANANPNEYNGTQTITKVDDKHFTYSIIEYPPSPASGSYTATNPASGVSRSVSGISYANDLVTVTAPLHGFLSGSTVVIAGVTPNAYNGSYVINVIDVNRFSYTLLEQPLRLAGSGTASITTKTTGKVGGVTCPCSTVYSIEAWNAGTPGVTRPLGSTTVTFTTINPGTTFASQFLSGTPTVTISGVVDSNGVPVAGYNGSFTVTSVSGNSFTISTIISPSSTISGWITATGVIPLDITNLTHAGTTATATVTAHGYANGSTISIGGTPGTNENAYLGTYTISNVTTSTFDYSIATTPVSPATGVGGVTMTATRSSGLDPANLTNMINWVRGMDNQADENGPGGTVTIRPSVHGDVLHSRPTVINYGFYPVSITATTDSGTTRTATASSTEVTTISSFGAYPIITFANGQACPVTVASATTFTYLASSCGSSGAQSAAVGSKIVVFYGDNSGVFHAVNGNQSSVFAGANSGNELWGFIPKEFFLKLNRQRSNSAQLNLPSTPPGITPKPREKDYFIDGSTGVYQYIDGTGTTTKAVLYLTMRRGGNFIYALDVSTPATPTVLWQIDTSSSDMSDLGQTWSQPKVARVKGYCGGSACSSTNLQTPVLIFGGGYDTNEDTEPPLANSSGRAIFVVDALTGAVIWKANYAASSSCSGNTYKAACGVAGMNYSIPSDITLVDRDLDGFIDRLYAADVGGNIWRVDLQPSGNATPNFWQVNQLAALGCLSGACSIPTSTSQRKFFYPPEVITASSTYNYDAVIAGSGDREHPLYINTSTQRYNRIYLLKDTYTGDDASGMSAITMTGSNPLFDATATPWDGTLHGYYLTLAAGEKIVNAPLVTAGYVYMGSNQPSTASASSCVGNLGVARGYQLSPFAGTLKYIEFVGGGLPPSPVSGIVNIVKDGVVVQMPFLIGGGNPDCVGSDCKSALGGQKPPITVSTKRTRTYRYIKNK